MKTHIVRAMIRSFTGCLLAAVLGAAGTEVFADVPNLINYQGRLLDKDDMPVSGTVNVVVTLYSDTTGGTELYREGVGPVPVVSGSYNFAFGADAATLQTALESPEVWIEVSIDGSPLAPRQRLLSVPYALIAGVAPNSVGSATISDGDVHLVDLNQDVRDDNDTRYVKKAGDTMTGALSLPRNGLSVGGGQLAVSADQVRLGRLFANSALEHVIVSDVTAGGALYLRSIDTLPGAAPGSVNTVTIRDGSIRLVDLDPEIQEDRNAHYVKKAGDTMTGKLALPANGLSVGGSQLVASGGKVGVGIATPGAYLHIKATEAVWDKPHLQLDGVGSTRIVQASSGFLMRNDYATADATAFSFRNKDNTHLVDIKADGEAALTALTVEGNGRSDGGVQSEEVVARFRNSTAGKHTAISVDAGKAQDPILYLAQQGSAIWGIRADVSDGTGENYPLEIRRQYGGTNEVAIRVTRHSGERKQGEVAAGVVPIATRKWDYFRMEVTGDIWPSDTRVFNLGSSTDDNKWRKVYTSMGVAQESDGRMKKDVQDLPYGINEVMKLRPVSFEWIQDGTKDVGLIAQEVDPVIPEAVEHPPSEDQMLSMNYSDLIPVLIKAVQEQQAQIKELQTQNKLLGESLAEMKAGSQ